MSERALALAAEELAKRVLCACVEHPLPLPRVWTSELQHAARELLRLTAMQKASERASASSHANVKSKRGASEMSSEAEECNLKECKSPAVPEKGVCATHLAEGYYVTFCQAKDCKADAWAKGLCHGHYAKLKRLVAKGVEEKEAMRLTKRAPIRSYKDNGGKKVEKISVFSRVEQDVGDVLKREAAERKVGVFSVVEDVLTRYARRKARQEDGAAA